MASITGPNGDTSSAAYDAFQRPISTTQPEGATTSYTYTPNASTATTGVRYRRTTVDGFGRTIRGEFGYNGLTTSTVDTVGPAPARLWGR